MDLLDQPLISDMNKKTHPRRLEAKANKLLKEKKVRRGKRKKNKRNLWLQINGLTLNQVKREAVQAMIQRREANEIEKNQRGLWKNPKTRDRKVV